MPEDTSAAARHDDGHHAQRARAAILLELSRRERAIEQPRARIPEPMALDGADSVEAFHVAGAEDGPMRPLYEVSAQSISRLLPARGLVLDLGCGSARSAVHLARRRPDARILGIDVADSMLRAGRALVDHLRLSDRVDLRQGDMRDISSLGPIRPAVVVASLALHHLPTGDDLHKSLLGIAEMLDRTGASLWLLDLARLRSPGSYRDLLARTPAIAGTLLAEALASEAAAWTFDELRESLGACGIECDSRVLAPLPLFQSHWRIGQNGDRFPEPTWEEAVLPEWAANEATAIARQLGVTVRPIPPDNATASDQRL